MLPQGQHKGTIVSNRSKKFGDKIAICIVCDVQMESVIEQVEAKIYLTDKSMGMARLALKVCGFDVDQTDMAMLDIRPTLLAGNIAPLVVSNYNGKPTVGIALDVRADKSEMADVQAKLRAAKHRDVAGPAPVLTEDIPF